MSAVLCPHCSHSAQALLAAHMASVCASAQPCADMRVSARREVWPRPAEGVLRQHWELGTTSMMMSESHWQSGFTEE